jgi:hypothetical protein
MLKRKVSKLHDLYHRFNQSINLTEGVTVMSLSASILQKIIVHMNHLCEITLNYNYSLSLKSGVNFQVYIYKLREFYIGKKITNCHCIMTHNSAVLIYFVAES